MPQTTEIIAALRQAGLGAFTFDKLGGIGSFRVAGVELSEMRLSTYQPAAGNFPAAEVLYLEPFQSVLDEAGREFPCGVRLPVTAVERQRLVAGPLRSHFVLFETGSTRNDSALAAVHPRRCLPACLREYAHVDLLIIDEFGFDRLERLESPQAASLLYKVIDARSQQRATVLVTNIDFGDWGEYLGDPPLAMALLDRVVHGAIILKITGKSYRAHRPQNQQSSPAK